MAEVTNEQRELIYSIINYLMYDECCIDWTTQNHLNLEDYIDRFEDLDGSI